MTVNYREPITIQHIKEAASVGAKKPSMGCIGVAARLKGSRFIVNSPGVGAYNLSSYASFSKVHQTEFDGEVIASSRANSRNYRSNVNSRSRGQRQVSGLRGGERKLAGILKTDPNVPKDDQEYQTTKENTSVENVRVEDAQSSARNNTARK